ncbi:glutamine--tRNA ligase/YqeY domain fusion protein [Deinococcus detaillensis]|uniref:Glutamine--tRNA ligase n=1 Tax=Deinococcus detaillensis TaxID=2592048 RepID=A0A553V4I8_9DEIO|nr:glutamine--tRNA ligase/YqeY domain fusion protein [Deinococcus detaillensis]TSA87400.1 glutamine--tRNA ligase/YqeY domain fusion protein [Deinococcus detaillensis]
MTSAADFVPPAPRVAPNFITEIIERDLKSGKYPKIVTRFPPEPNGYAHLGHTFACFLDFQTALQYGGTYHLRLDDTNPAGESVEFAEAIQDDLRWLGWDWGENLFYASDNFERYYAYAVQLIEMGKAYVDSVSGEEMARLRGSATQRGTPSAYRERSVAENLELFARMRAGEFADGAHILRAKIDLSSSNMKLRDPVLYRILRGEHYRQGAAWCIYPMYDFQHPLQDAIEGVTHSMCSLEFVDNRAIYDWLMETLAFEPRPHQYEFGRRSLEYTVVSKRKLRRLVQEGHVSGWDDPRMPTLRAIRRLGVRPEAVNAFASAIGVSRTNRTVDLAVYENAVRDDLNPHAPRVMAVLEPLEVVVSSAGGQALEAKMLSLPYWPHDVIQASLDGLVALPSGQRVEPDKAVREVSLSTQIYIERGDFALTPPKGFKRLILGGAVRLRGAGILRADEVIQDEAGQVTGIRATLLGEESSVKPAGVIHWVDAATALSAEFRLYDRLFSVPNPDGPNPNDILPDFDPEQPGHEDLTQPLSTDFLRFLNPESLKIVQGYVEGSVAADPAGTRYQFERQGYFWPDPEDSRPEALVFNRIITLRDTWTGKTEPATKTRAVKTEQKKAEAPTLSADQSAEVARLRSLGVSEAEAVVLARDPLLGAYFGSTTQQAGQVAAWVVNDLSAAVRAGQVALKVSCLPALAELLASGEISSRIAKDVLTESLESGEAPTEIVQRRGLKVVSDSGELERIIDGVLSTNPDKLAEYRGGRAGLLGFFTGQVMKASGGQAEPKAVAALLKAKLDG